jgi:cystathionine beta-lyase
MVSAEAKANSLTFMAPSKTFNIAGIVSSFAVIPGKEVRERFLAYLQPRELQQGTLFAFTATRAAYEECDDWLRQMLDYVQGNVRFVDGYLREHLPAIEAMIPEASFLMWLDCRRLGLSQPELVRFFVDKAGLALNDGTIFGREGEGFMRLNVGTSRFVLRKALNQLKNALLSLPTNWYTSEPIGW